MGKPIEIHSKKFTFLVPVKEGEPNVIKWIEEGRERIVTVIVKPSAEALQRIKIDDKLWYQIGRLGTDIFLKKTEWDSLSPDDKSKLKEFFTTTFQEAVGIAKKVRVKRPNFGSEIVAEEAERAKTLVEERLVELIAAAKSSKKKTSKMVISKKIGVIRCELQQTGDVKISIEREGGKGSYKTAKKVIDFGCTEMIVAENKAYAYLKLHDLKTLSPREVEARIKTLRDEIGIMNFLAQHGAQNMVQFREVKTRQVVGEDERDRIGIIMEWFDLGDAKWIGMAPPEKDTKEYIDVIRIACDAAVGLASLHALNYIHSDVKPANFFITSGHGQVAARLGDFGSAVPVGAKRKACSLAYAAPELCDIGFIATTQSDAWSFGVGLLEMFHGSDANKFLKMKTLKNWRESLTQIVPVLEQIIPTLDPTSPIDGLILDCLEKEPQNRPTLQQIVERLQEALLVESPPKKPLSPKEEALREAQEMDRLLAWKLKAKTPAVSEGTAAL